LNVAGYFDAFFDMIDHAVSEGFIKKEMRMRVKTSHDPQMLLKELTTLA